MLDALFHSENTLRFVLKNVEEKGVFFQEMRKTLNLRLITLITITKCLKIKAILTVEHSSIGKM